MASNEFIMELLEQGGETHLQWEAVPSPSTILGKGRNKPKRYHVKGKAKFTCQGQHEDEVCREDLCSLKNNFWCVPAEPHHSVHGSGIGPANGFDRLSEGNHVAGS